MLAKGHILQNICDGFVWKISNISKAYCIKVFKDCVLKDLPWKSSELPIQDAKPKTL